MNGKTSNIKIYMYSINKFHHVIISNIIIFQLFKLKANLLILLASNQSENHLQKMGLKNKTTNHLVLNSKSQE